jgi:hypothetical protein
MRDIYWAPHDAVGLEHLRFGTPSDRVVAEAMILRRFGDEATQIHYAIECDPEFRTRRLFLEKLAPVPRVIDLRSDRDGRWTDAGGVQIPELEGCIDVDISATPFTNTLPIRRLRLRPGQSALLSVVYVNMPRAAVSRAMQRYTCLEQRSNGGRYRYESVDTGFTVVLDVDSDGIVYDYPGLFRRVLDTGSEPAPVF